jgi:hypothetical protein
MCVHVFIHVHVQRKAGTSPHLIQRFISARAQAQAQARARAQAQSHHNLIIHYAAPAHRRRPSRGLCMHPGLAPDSPYYAGRRNSLRSRSAGGSIICQPRQPDSAGLIFFGPEPDC